MTPEEARDFTGQVKKAHILLASVSLGVLLAVAIGPDPELREAIADLSSVEEAVGDAASSRRDPSATRSDAIDRDWLFEVVARWEVEIDPPEGAILDSDENTVTLQTWVRTGNELLPMTVVLPAVTAVGPGRPNLSSVPNLSLSPSFTIGRFMEFWNDLDSVQIVHRFGRIASISALNGDAVWEPRGGGRSGLDGNPLVLHVTPFQLSAGDSLESPSHYAEGTARQRQSPFTSVRVRIQAHYFSLRVDAQNVFSRIAFGEDDMKSGTFSEAFPELAEYTEGLESLTVSDLTTLMDREARRSGESFEFAGLNVPVEVVRVWGGGLIVLSQLYFLVHLAALSGAIVEEGIPTRLPWVGYYVRDPLAGLVFLTSVILLPTLATAWFAVQAGFLRDVGPIPVLLQATLAVVAVWVAWATWSKGAQMRRALRKGS